MGKINRGDAISPTFEASFGNLAVGRGKGKISGNALWSWDALQGCTAEACPAADQCEFLKRDMSRYGYGPEKCKVMGAYLKSVTTTILGTYEAQLDQGQLFRIGMHIMPLYKNLVKMKIEELGVLRVVNRDANGKLSINPLYKEIREYIKLIEQMWKSVGIAGGSMIGAPGNIPLGTPQGDGNYYERMEKEAFADIHQQRGKKLSLVRRTEERE